jgi:DMSO/TMAO reductase YedYZ molybdopterin-dependent catalytic subunit
VTPTASFFVRCNFDIPALSASQHQVELAGALERPQALGVGQLQLLGARKETVTLECAGNGRIHMRPLPAGAPWNDGAVSTAEWTGVPLERVLDQAGLSDQATHLLIEGADAGDFEGQPGRRTTFARALPREKALRPDTLLAWGMNGEPLPRAHGGPVRLIVPGWYAMASVKWVTRITALTHAFEGPFQGERYVYDPDDGSAPTPVEAMRVKAQLLSPRDGERLPEGPVELWGRAWSGEQAIASVEVQVGGEGAWEPARLLEPARPSCWVAWSFAWTPARTGQFVLRARATDTAGRTQPERTPANRLGYGENSIPAVRVEIV